VTADNGGGFWGFTGDKGSKTPLSFRGPCGVQVPPFALPALQRRELPGFWHADVGRRE